MRNRRSFRFLAVLALVLFTAAYCHGQAVNNAQIHGFVADPSGAAVPGAQLTATQTDTGAARTVTSGGDGNYAIPDLPVGPYQLEAKAAGFQLYVQKGIVLQVGQDVQINIGLQVGKLTETLEVQADAAMVETRETAVAAVLDQRRIIDLPLDGRQATELVTLSGAATNPRLSSPLLNNDLISTKNYANGLNNSSVAISVAGGQVNATNYLLDGGDNVDMFSDVSLPFPFPDAIQEFSVQTSTLSARYGVHPGALVNVVTKAGTNSLHGDAFEFIRNNYVNAAPFFLASGGVDSLKRNQFGGTLGGPIAKDKLMFFVGYQGTRYIQNAATALVQVPTAAVMAGNFGPLETYSDEPGGCVTRPKGATGTMRPLSTTYFTATDQLKTGVTFNPQALNLLKLIPAPTSSTDPCGFFSYGIPNDATEEQGISRIDWTKSSKQSIFVRYFISDYSNPPVYDGVDILTSTKAGQLSRSQSLTIGHLYSFGLNLVNSLHVTGTRLAIFRGSAPNLPNFSTFGVDIPNPLPNSLVLSVTGYFNVANGTATPGHFNRNAYQAADDIDWTVGKHQFTFGVDAIYFRLNELSNQLTNGQFNFSGDETSAGSAGGDGLADFMLGLVKTFNQGNPEWENWRQMYYGLYGQDSVKLTHRLTVNAGVRWEPYYPAADAYHRGSHFDPTLFASGSISKTFPQAPPGLLYCGDTGTPCSYVNSHWQNFSPRVGIAWDPRGTGRETIRAGYAIFYDNPEVFYFDRFADNSPFGSSISLTTPPGGFTNPYAGQTVPQFPTPFPTSSNATFFQNGVYINIPLVMHPTYLQAWNLSIEKQVGANWLFSATYMGNKTTHIWGGYQADAPVLEGTPVTSTNANCKATYNPLVPYSCTKNEAPRRLLTLENVMFTPPGGTSTNAGLYFSSLSQASDGFNADYNGLLLSANHRFNNNFTLLANYTFSRCISEYDFSGELASGGRLIAEPNPTDLAAERGNCAFDHRQILNASGLVNTPKFHDAPLEAVLGNWQWSMLGEFQTGGYFTVFSGTDNSLTGIGNDRADIVPNGGVNWGYCAVKGVIVPVRTPECWFNTSAFTTNALGTFGDSGRNSVLGPGFFTINTAISKGFAIKERYQVQLRVEVFNLLNHPIFYNPGVAGESNLSANGNQFGKSNYGQITATPQDSQRILQGAVKFVF